VAPPSREPVTGPVELWSWFDLPRETRSEELSGIAWDDATRTLWAVQDHMPRIVELRPDEALKTWQLGSEIAIKVSDPLDLEGIVVLRTGDTGFLVCSEIGPRVLELDRSGALRREIVVPQRFREARANKSLESLAMSPDARYLFTTSEIALPADGDAATRNEGTRLRIARIDRTTGEVTEHAYLTDPAIADGADQGVADLCALAADEVLVLERGFAKGIGNTVRIYRSTLDERSACRESPRLGPESAFLTKSLFVDVAKLEPRGVPPAPAPQPTPLLDNYEGITLGPRLPDGRRTLLLASDDNARPDQVARIVVLAVGASGT
jgi:hypothetical protein